MQAAAVLEVLADLPSDVLDRRADGAVTIAITDPNRVTTSHELKQGTQMATGANT